MFGTRVKTFQKKLEEHKATLNSPIPSPDINAPSPNSDSDIELPEEDQKAILNQSKGKEHTSIFCFAHIIFKLDNCHVFVLYIPSKTCHDTYATCF